jgi:cAMP-specific phosphodiesterase 4
VVPFSGTDSPINDNSEDDKKSDRSPLSKPSAGDDKKPYREEQDSPVSKAYEPQKRASENRNSFRSNSSKALGEMPVLQTVLSGSSAGSASFMSKADRKSIRGTRSLKTFSKERRTSGVNSGGDSTPANSPESVYKRKVSKVDLDDEARASLMSMVVPAENADKEQSSGVTSWGLSASLQTRPVDRNDAAAPLRRDLLFCCHAFSRCRRKAAPYCRQLIKLKSFQLAMFVALIGALFLPDTWILLDRESNDDLDIVLTIILVAFLVELSVQANGLSKTYFNTFFFYMDITGALSLLLDLTYLGLGDMLAGRSGDGESQTGNVMIQRVAKIAKLGARAGRFTRLIKLLRYLPGMSDSSKEIGTAKLISARLVNGLSTRVSCLIIVMVVVMPLFSMWTYPEQDYSMEGWLLILDTTATQHPERLAYLLTSFTDFFGSKDISHFPYRVEVKEKSIPKLSNASLAFFPWIKEGGLPTRESNSNTYVSENFICKFNFSEPNQTDSIMNMVLMCTVMVLMIGFSLVLSNSITTIVFSPLEKLLLKVRTMGSTIFQSVSDMAVTMADDSGLDADEAEEDDCVVDNANAFGNETELLEKVVQKLAVLSEISITKSAVDAEMVEGLADEEKAIIHGWDQTNNNAPEDLRDSDFEQGSEDEEDLAEMIEMMDKAGLSQELLDSWNLNPLELDSARNHAAVVLFVSHQNHGMPFDPYIMTTFLETAEAGYLKTCSFHNWFHAVDTSHCVYRLLKMNHAHEYLTGLERFSLIISAICHDIDHPGLNNAFLIETAHELSMRYNDKSPLENMHASRLFEIISDPKRNILELFSPAQYKEARRKCVDAILHTDNSSHFAMVKDVQMTFEVNSEILESARAGPFPTKDAIECFRQPDSRRLLVNLMLHLADISNSMKPFRICRIWAWQLLDEFFVQGDLEKRLAVPVQALNDRDKINCPFCQIGFIEFLVSPLVNSSLKILPPLEDRAEQMLANAKTWHQQWITEADAAKGGPSDQERRIMADRVAKLEVRFVEATAQ